MGEARANSSVRGRHDRLYSLLEAAVLAAALLSLLGYTAFSQTNDTNTTTTPITITIPPVNVTSRPVWMIDAYLVNDTLHILATCISVSQCQELSINVYAVYVTDTKIPIYNVTVQGEPLTKTNITINVTQEMKRRNVRIEYVQYIDVEYKYDSISGVYRLVYRRKRVPAYGVDVATVIAALAVISVMVRSDPKMAVIGALVYSILVYSLLVTGYVRPVIGAISYMMVIVAVLLIIAGVRV